MNFPADILGHYTGGEITQIIDRRSTHLPMTTKWISYRPRDIRWEESNGYKLGPRFANPLQAWVSGPRNKSTRSRWILEMAFWARFRIEA